MQLFAWHLIFVGSYFPNWVGVKDTNFTIRYGLIIVFQLGSTFTVIIPETRPVLNTLHNSPSGLRNNTRSLNHCIRWRIGSNPACHHCSSI